ncbi:hypothetical protein B0H17DRAFT_1183380 [Mycena rosella]|uniref:Uncharacterized protein n=1 Tax=Mycena rosella TaxID=1033263 RepID=A0AAD7G716_MYCRO|nr:hypothetical protein B0H17DRAFT_1183380 [Mycena rosella]
MPAGTMLQDRGRAKTYQWDTAQDLKTQDLETFKTTQAQESRPRTTASPQPHQDLSVGHCSRCICLKTVKTFKISQDAFKPIATQARESRPRKATSPRLISGTLFKMQDFQDAFDLKTTQAFKPKKTQASQHLQDASEVRKSRHPKSQDTFNTPRFKTQDTTNTQALKTQDAIKFKPQVFKVRARARIKVDPSRPRTRIKIRLKTSSRHSRPRARIETRFKRSSSRCSRPFQVSNIFKAPRKSSQAIKFEMLKLENFASKFKTPRIKMQETQVTLKLKTSRGARSSTQDSLQDLKVKVSTKPEELGLKISRDAKAARYFARSKARLKYARIIYTQDRAEDTFNSQHSKLLKFPIQDLGGSPFKHTRSSSRPQHEDSLKTRTKSQELKLKISRCKRRKVQGAQNSRPTSRAKARLKSTLQTEDLGGSRSSTQDAFDAVLKIHFKPPAQINQFKKRQVEALKTSVGARSRIQDWPQDLEIKIRVFTQDTSRSPDSRIKRV